MGLPKFDKMELIIQKAVELGVSEIVPVTTRRTVWKFDAKKRHQTCPLAGDCRIGGKAGEKIVHSFRRIKTFSKALEEAGKWIQYSCL